MPECLVANREAFSGFDVDAVAKYTEKQMASLSADFGLDLGTVRGTVNNACRILEVPSVNSAQFIDMFSLPDFQCSRSVIAVRNLRRRGREFEIRMS